MTVMDEGNRRAAQHRLAILTAIDSALHQHVDVSAVIEAAADRDDALAAVRTLLGVGRIPAQAVLALSWERHAEDARQRITAEIDEQAAALSVVIAPHAVWTAPPDPFAQ